MFVDYIDSKKIRPTFTKITDIFLRDIKKA